MGLPCGSDGKESACNAGYLGLLSGSVRSPGEGNGNPLQYSCLKNSVHEVAKSWTQLSNYHSLRQSKGKEIQKGNGVAD